jgi:isopenicillin-N N-acyltransferase like protein
MLASHPTPLTPTGYYRWHGEDGWIVHTNHFLNPIGATVADNVLPNYDDSAHRYQRFCELVRARAGTLDVSAIQEILSDHAGYRRRARRPSLCRHVQPGHHSKTIASLIAEPERGLLHVAGASERRNPCQNDYTTYVL